MLDVEKSKLIDLVNGLSEEDCNIILGSLPESMLWDELRRRAETKSEIIRDISSRLGVTVEV